MREQRRVALATGELNITVHESAFPLDELCGFAARHNPKRGFLFVSKVLGKHWPAAPSAMRQIHQCLADQLALSGPSCAFIAMAETATGLGQGVFERVLERHPRLSALFLHSTRYRLADHQPLAFEEAHCHAPAQLLYPPSDPAHLQLFNTASDLVVIDDEISTGATLCNLVAVYRRLNPELCRVHVVSIANFGGVAAAERFARDIDIPVRWACALRADFQFTPSADFVAEPPPPAVGDNRVAPEAISLGLGRFGIDHAVEIPATDLPWLTAGLAPGAAVLVLGTGEFMHPAFCLGDALERAGFAVKVQATTRSPILIGADIGSRLEFPDNYGEGICNYLYNVDPSVHARIILCHETPDASVAALRARLGDHCLSYRPLP